MANGASAPSRSFTEDVASNSSLTATASEFIPGSASHSLCSRPSGAKFRSSASSKEGTASSFVRPNIRSRTFGRSNQAGSQSASNKGIRYFRRHDDGESMHAVGSSRDPSQGLESNGSTAVQSGQPRTPNKSAYNRSSHEVHQSGSHHRVGSDTFGETNKGWRSERSQDSSFYHDGAVGGTASEQQFSDYGNHDKSCNSKEYRSGFNRNRDRNGNKNNSGGECVQQDNKSRLNNDDNDVRDQTSERSRKERGRNFAREFDYSKDRNRYWDRRPDHQRDGDYNPESGSSHRYYNQQSGRQDFQSYNRNRQYGDHNSERHRDQYSRDHSDSLDQDYDRGYVRRGNRQFTDANRNDSSQKRPSYRDKGSNASFIMRETFGSDRPKSPPSGTHQDSGSSLGRENTYYKSGMKQFNYRDGDDVSQRERLTEQLCRGTLECLVCCDRVRQMDSVWSCANCFHVLHMRCVMKWAKSSKSDTGWRCPACQNVTEMIPSQYRCFCGKVLNPQWNRQDTPHTCGEVCGKSRQLQRPLCTHRCTLLCHPGPCPPCVAQVSRSCGCGKTSKIVKCGLEKPLLCESVCSKTQNCGVHTCSKVCHTGPCEECTFKVQQVCFCGKHQREVDCTVENQDVAEYCCEDICNHTLKCGNHSCDEICHPGECKSCILTPDVVSHCPCGKTKLSSDPEHMRLSCIDPIPTCDMVCQRKLPCGQPSNPHTCKAKCHIGHCPPCPLTTMVRCRCGHMDREILCEQLTTKADDARCEKKCAKKRSCAKHKCNQQCCIEVDHPCPLPCNRTLSCGLHRCEQLCHRGRCPSCWRSSFEELYCECGTAVLYPPIPCGTKPPPCSRPCSRQHDCDHSALHTCHSEPNCPPCTHLTEKYCYGKHELRKSIPCHQKEFSCGLPCNKELPCGRHKCIQVCHKDDCLRSGSICTQPCSTPRSTCQHPCSAPCHLGACPDIPCKETVRVTCECGHRSAMRPCAENTREYQRIATSLLASKMADVQLGHSIDIGDIMGNPSTRKLYLKSLECNDECKIIERNRRMAIGLQIRNPDLSSKLTPRYSDFMRGWAKKDPVFCQMVHDKLTELVKLAKESKQKSRSYSFEVMNREKRQFVHEYCEHFGCESVAYDQEPKRNIVATAQKTKAWLPSVSLLELVQREAGQRKVPGPMLNSSKKLTSKALESIPNKWASTPSVSGVVNAPSAPATQATPSVPNTMEVSSATPYIDYFNS